MRKFWRNPAANRLNDYWNVAWAGTVPDGVPPREFADPAQMDMIDRIHGLYHPERLDESVVASLEIQLMNAFSTAYEISPALPSARPKRIVARPTWLPQREEILPRKWSLAAVASVALVAITLAVFFFSFRQTDHPALVPGTPDIATPTTAPIPASEPLVLFQGAEPVNNTARLYTMNLDGSNVQEVTHSADGWSQHPDWSPDGQSIVFIKDEERSIWSMDADGANQKHLFTCTTECSFPDYAVWSSDGTQIAFVGYTVDDNAPTQSPPNTSALLVMDVATGKTRIVTQTDLPLVVDTPQWSPDDSTIVLAVNTFGDSFAQTGSALATVPSAGGDLTYLTDFDSFAYYPTWSAQTNLIAFSTETYVNSTISGIYAKAWNLYTIKPDGTGLTQLTDVGAGVHMMQPSWTADGEKLLATVESDGTLLACWVDPTTGGITPITTSGRQTNVQLQPRIPSP